MVPHFEFYDDIDGARPNFAVYYIMRTGMFMEGPHYHTAEETLYFVSSNPRDMKNLGATVEIAFEESGEVYDHRILPGKFPRESCIVPLCQRAERRSSSDISGRPANGPLIAAGKDRKRKTGAPE
jgi:hypothetical protein